MHNSAPHFPRRSHRPKAFNAMKISDEVKATRAAMLEAKRLADEAAHAKEQTASAVAALQAEDSRKAEMSRHLAEAKQREASIAEALRAVNATISPVKTKATK